MATKFFYATMNNAPTLTPNWGSLLTVLKACLLNGFNEQSAGAVTIADGVATVPLSSGHGFLQHQVVLLSGANESEANTEFVVTESNANAIKFKTSLSSITGTITLKTAPLGWTELFMGENKAIFAAKDRIKNPFVLRVDDSLPTGYDTSWAKFARVTIAENAKSIDDFTGYVKAPQVNGDNINEQGNGTVGASGVYGMAKWYHGVQTYGYLYEASTNGQPANLDWVLIGDDTGFYFLPQITDQTGRASYAFAPLNTNSTLDKWACFLSATEGRRQANQNGNYYNDGRNSNKNQWWSGHLNGKYLLRPYDGRGNSHITCSLFSLNVANNQQVSGRSGDIPFPNKPDNAVILHDIYVKDSDGIRGTLPYIKWIHQQWALQDKAVLDKAGGKYLIVGTDFRNEGMTSFLAFELEV